MEIFFQKIWLSHTTIYGSLKPVSEKNNEPTNEDGSANGISDEQTLFYRTLPAEAGGPKTLVFLLLILNK